MGCMQFSSQALRGHFCIKINEIMLLGERNVIYVRKSFIMYQAYVCLESGEAAFGHKRGMVMFTRSLKLSFSVSPFSICHQIHAVTEEHFSFKAYICHAIKGRFNQLALLSPFLQATLPRDTLLPVFFWLTLHKLLAVKGISQVGIVLPFP